MNFNKNMMSDIFRASVKTFKEMESDSKNFRENNKKTNDALAALNTGEIPVQKCPIPVNCDTGVIYSNIMSNLARHIARGLDELPSYINIKSVSNPLAIRIAYIKSNIFCVRLDKRTPDNISIRDFHNEIMPILNERVRKVRFNAEQDLFDIQNDYREDLQHLNFMLLNSSELEYWSIQDQLNRLQKEYNQTFSEINVFLNTISFFSYCDYGAYVDLYFSRQ